MELPKGSGLEQLEQVRKMFLSRYKKCTLDRSKNIKYKPLIKILTDNLRSKAKAPAVQNPLDMLLKGLKSTLSQFTRKTDEEDYESIVKGFIPEGARLVKPLYPPDSNEILTADIDGDLQNELIASYKHNNAVNTMVLKKQNGQWHKTSEIINPEHDGLHYRNISDITGDGKKHLLIGMSSKGKAHSIYGYSLNEATAKKMFVKNYEWAELVGPKNKDRNEKTQLALWSRGENGAYNVEVLKWNGLQLEPLKDVTPYYYNRMVPYYKRKLQQNPRAPHSWYNLADALVKAEVYNDALTITDMGLRQNLDPSLIDKFSALRKEITDRL